MGQMLLGTLVLVLVACVALGNAQQKTKATGMTVLGILCLVMGLATAVVVARDFLRNDSSAQTPRERFDEALIGEYMAYHLGVLPGMLLLVFGRRASGRGGRKGPTFYVLGGTKTSQQTAVHGYTATTKTTYSLDIDERRGGAVRYLLVKFPLFFTVLFYLWPLGLALWVNSHFGGALKGMVVPGELGMMLALFTLVFSPLGYLTRWAIDSQFSRIFGVSRSLEKLTQRQRQMAS
jgi:hypothetical protein